MHDRSLDPGRLRCADRLLDGNPEQGDEAVDRLQGERVHTSIARGGESERPGSRREGVEGLWPHERAVGHHDEGACSGALVPKRQGDRVRVPGARIPEDLDAVGREARIRRHE